MRFEVENSGLDPAELDGVLPGPGEPVPDETATRGLPVDMLVAVTENVTSVAVTTSFAGLWLAWKRRRQRELKDSSAATVRVKVFYDDGTAAETMVDLHGDGGDGIRKLELAFGDSLDSKRVSRIRVTFPEDR